jgi:hypothetical protein
MASRAGTGNTVTAGIATVNGPPLSLPLGYFVAGAIAFVAVNLALLLDAPTVLTYYLLPDDLALTHLATLGWVTMTIMGALCQLVPVIFQTRLAHPRLLHWQFWLYLAGVTGLILSFRALWTPGLAVFGSLVLLAVLVFLYVMARTLWRPPAWPLTGHYLAHSLGYLGITVLSGITFALDLHFRWFAIPRHILAAHVDLGLAGWFTLTLMGVNYQLLPMFALVHGHSLRLGRWVLRVCNLGVSCLFIALLFDLARPLVLAAALTLTAGIIAYVADVYRMFRLRRRRTVDLSQQHTVISTVCLLIAVVVGLRIAFAGPADFSNQTHWYLALVYVVIGGWISPAIMGQLYKILPFLVWQHRYSDRAGREPVPLLRDLYSERRARLVFACYLSGFVVVTLALLAGSDAALRAGAALTSAGSLGFAWTFVEVLRPRRGRGIPGVAPASQSA